MGGSAGKTIKRAGLAGITGGISEFGQTNPFGVNGVPNANGVAHSLLPSWFPNQNNPSQTVSGPFSIDPSQIAADQKAINDLGQRQSDEIKQYNTSDQASRAQSRDALAKALTTQSQAVFKQGLPDTEETLNAQHLLNGSGLGQEIARQQGNIATNIANTVGVQGANDINRASDITLGGLQGQQALGQAALSRGFSLNDFINQANVAKSIGATAAPQVGNGKGQTGALLSGVGSIAPPVMGAMKGFGKGGPAGAVVGGAAPLITSSIGSNLG